MDESTERPLSAIVLAAGHGTRMRSERPKPLHVLVGKPMVVWVIDALADCDVDRVAVVVGHGAEAVTKRLVEDAGDRPLEFVEQTVQRGTGDAVTVGLTGLAEDWDEPHDVLVLTGDTPLLRPSTLAALVERHRATDAACTVLTAELPDPTGYGRIVRGRDDRVVRIVEEVDTTEEERAIQEINTGIFCFRRSMLSPALRRIQPDNAQGELYLTDVVGVLADAGHLVATLVAGDRDETHGINDRVQLAAAEAELRRRINAAWMRAGVTMVDPRSTYIDADVGPLGKDVWIGPGVALRGKTQIGDNVRIDLGSVLTDVTVGDDTHIKPYSVLSESVVGEKVQIGPFSHCRPGTRLDEDAHIGNFVETKKTHVMAGAKANHLAYLGDASIGQKANIGAGTITCNYDGVSKFKTTIEAGAFIGSDSQLVAPVTVGRDAYVGSGTTVTKDVPRGALALTRVKQVNVEGWADRFREAQAKRKKSVSGE